MTRPKMSRIERFYRHCSTRMLQDRLETLAAGRELERDQRMAIIRRILDERTNNWRLV